MFVEFVGKVIGILKGCGGLMYLVNFEKGNYGINGIVGGGYVFVVGVVFI